MSDSGSIKRSQYSKWIFIILLGSVLQGSCFSLNEDTNKPIVFAEHGAWTWFNDERAIIADSTLLIGFVDTSGHSAVSMVNLEDPSSHTITQLSSFAEQDDHNNPAFIELADGTILATYAAHHSQYVWYRRHGKFNHDGSLSWSEEHQTSVMDERITYNNLFQLSSEGGKIYNFFRGINFDPTFMSSEDGGYTWSEAQHFISSGDNRTRPYVKYASDNQNRIDLLFTQAHPRDAETGIFHAYYEKGYIHKSDGTIIQKMPGPEADAFPVNSGTRIYNAKEAGRAWVWDLEYTPEGNPVAVFINAMDSTIGNDLRYRYATWNPQTRKWSQKKIALAGTHLYDREQHYAGGITIDPQNTNRVYISANVHPVTGQQLEHYHIYEGVRNVETGLWSWKSVTPYANEDNIRPTVLRNKDHQVLLWLRGRYTTYTDFDMEIVGLVKK